MRYIFAFALNPEDLADVTILEFEEGATPVVPCVRDRIEYGSPLIVGNVVSREIRFLYRNPIELIYVLFVVNQDKSILTFGSKQEHPG